MNRKRILVLLLVAGGLYAAHRAGYIDLTAPPSADARSETPVSPRSSPRGQGETTSETADLIADAFADQRSGFMVETTGVVDRLLADDDDGSRHQRFVLRLSNGHTVLVAHNIDLAQRVPVEAGDTIEIKGQYEWNERGGVLHWTHHDPDGSHEEGWIEFEGSVYE